MVKFTREIKAGLIALLAIGGFFFFFQFKKGISFFFFDGVFYADFFIFEGLEQFNFFFFF